MAGINASAASKTHAASGADVAVSGFITGEQVSLTATPGGTNYTWTISLPSGSSALRVGFAGDDTASAAFTPDVPGLYAVTAIVDGATYFLRLSVTQLAVSYALEALRLSPVANSQVPAPAVGGALFWSADSGALCVKDSAGTVRTVTVS